MRLHLLAPAAALIAGTAFPQDRPGDFGPGKVLPGLKLKKVDSDEKFDFEDCRRKKGEEDGGKIVVVTFWSFKCPTGKASMDRFREIYNFCKENGVEFVGICSYGESAEELKAYKKKHRIEYTLVVDEDQAAARAFGARVVTESYILDRDGRCLYRGALASSRRVKRALREALEEILAGKEVTVKRTRARG